MNPRRFCLPVCLSFLCAFGTLLAAQTPAVQQPDASAAAGTLLQGFENPPNGARPRVWWHWMNGNISEPGIKLDLDWMHRIGLGGVTIFEGAIDTPQVIPQRLVYMTPEWKQAFTYAVTTAKNMDMEVAIASSPGWSESGGPWVPASQGMKKMVWSATRVEGGQPFTGVLPMPPRVDGTFQNDRAEPEHTADGKIEVLPQFYLDSAVVAYRIPDGDETQAQLNPQVTASGGSANVPALSDGDVNTVALDLPAAAPGSQSWVLFDYGHPQTIQAITLATADATASIWDDGNTGILPVLEASDDGQTFGKIADIPRSSVVERTVSFTAVTARYFRLVFPGAADAQENANQRITELVLASGARVDEFEKRAGFATTMDYYAISDPNVAPKSLVAKSDIVDLTGKMKPDGSLDWTPPAGNWMVLRIGESLTGHVNGPAPAEATGLEVDKLNRDSVKSYLDGYLKMYSDTVGPSLMGSAGISFLLTDSIEAGAQNWTDDILEQFQKLRGYDPHPWLPALTGVVIGSTTDTDKFLWDFRRTLGQLVAENHYGELSDELHRSGLHYYSEALEFHRPMLGDDMEMRSKADVPMGAMWTWTSDAEAQPDYIADTRGAASVAHIYGQNLAGAESMTSPGPAWSFAPDTLKKIADLEFAEGINRFEIHESTHQPVPDLAPGLTLGPYGLWFNRNQTWADEAGPWVTYLARSSYLLQQGHYYGDVAYFYGQQGPLTAVFGANEPKDAPQGYGYDYVNSDVVLNHLSFKDGRWVASGGTSYRILYLGGESQRMTLPVLLKLRDLVAQGATLVGNRPGDSPSLADDNNEFHHVTDQLWGKKPEKAGTAHKFGKGRVYSGMTPNEALAALNVLEDFDYIKPEPDTKLLFLHRRLDAGDAYFVDNRRDRDENLSATFRVEGKVPELWDAATGTVAPVSYRIADGRTTVPLHLDPYGAIFVIFLKPATTMDVELPAPHEAALDELDGVLNGDWSVNFQPGRGAPEKAKFDRLTSWSDNANYGVKYFSGTATYSKTVDIPATALAAGAHLWLDLGDVKDVAEVAVNGKYLGILWKTPYKLDVTSALQPGTNQLVIQVTNLWVNRMIGDQQPWSLKKYTFADIAPYKADSPLLPSGLLGPVHFISVTQP